MSGRSAIVESGDGEMTIPPVMQPVLDIFSPLSNLSPVTGPVQDSFMFDSRLTRTGAGVAQNESMPTLASGRWNCQIQHTSGMSGATVLANACNCYLVDPDGGTYAMSRFNFLSWGSTRVTTFTIPLLTLRPGWFFQNALDATVAGDVAFSNVILYARRTF